MMRRALAVVPLLALGACTPTPTSSSPSRFPTGTAPNAATRVTCTDSPRALVAASVDGSLNIIDVVTGTTTSVQFGTNTNPWDVAVVDDTSSVTGLTDPTAVVTLYGTNTIATTKVCSSTAVADTFSDDEVIVSDGIEYTPGNPQAIAVIDHDIYVASTNIIRVATGADDMQTGPGTLLRLHVDTDGTLQRDARLVLPCDNPSAIAVNNTTLGIACTGRYRTASGGGFERASDSQGAIILVESTTLTITETLAVDASPVSAVFDIDGTLVVGDALDGSVSRYINAPLRQLARVAATDVANDSVFALSIVNDTLVAAAFSGTLVGGPFGTTPQRFTVDDGLSRGIVDVAFQPGDADVYALLTLSAELARVPTDGLVPAAQVQP